LVAAALMRPLQNERTMKKLFALLMLPAILTGCTSTITNLAPTHYARDASGYYRVEAEWFTRRHVVRPDSFKPLVVVGFDTYPMQPVPLVADRWEAFVPVPPDKDTVVYHYKFDFVDDAIGGPHPDSLLSRDYELKIK
jgi:hypothetical protein